MRLCKLGVAWQNSHAQKYRELAQCVKNVSSIHRAKLRSPAMSVFRRKANSTKDALGGKEHLEIERSHHHNFSGN